jgi:hypothetical protein
MIFSGVFIVSGQEFGTAGKGNSQILRAYEASNIVVGEVVYVGDPWGSPYSTVPFGTQTIVYRLVEVIKGPLSDKMFNVAVSVPLSKNGDLKWFIAPGQKHILLLGKISELTCNDVTLDPATKLERTKSEFDKYRRLSCYFIEADSVIEASTKEIEAVQMFNRKRLRQKGVKFVP